MSSTLVLASKPLVVFPLQGKRFYQPELDALRFVAFFSVFLYHISFLKPPGNLWWDSFNYAGAFGMSLFFTLSSYLITSLLLKEKASTGTIAIGKFYARRVLRIWPLYFTFLFAIWLVGHVLFKPWAVDRGTLASFLLLYGNWYVIHAVVSGPVMPLWSISLEEQFYLFWPSLFRWRSIKSFLWVAAALVSVSWITIVWLRAAGRPYWEIWWNTLPQLEFFALGGILAIYRDRIFRRNLSPLGRAAFGGAALTFWFAGGFANHFAAVGIQPSTLLLLSYLASAVGCVLFFQSFWAATVHPAWIYLGKISYGLYVFHQVSLDTSCYIWARLYGGVNYLPIAAMALTITLICASISFPLLEKPFLRWKRHFEIVRSR